MSLNKAKFKELEKKVGSKSKSKKDDIGNFIDNELKMFKVNKNGNNDDDNSNKITTNQTANLNINNNIKTKATLLKSSNFDTEKKNMEGALKIPSNLRIGLKKNDKPVTAINDLCK